MLSLEGLHRRAAFFRSIRTFFHQQGFLEVDTPLRQPVYIPESNIVPISAEGQFLQTSPELCMKRLLAHGCEKIFQLCHCFRKDEVGKRHLEEFRMLEWYRAGCDYQQLMADCENLLKFLHCTLSGDPAFPGAAGNGELFRGLDLTPPWPRLKVADAFIQYSPVSLQVAMESGSFDELLTEYIEPHLGLQKPVFLYEYPQELASLARRSPSNPEVAERFELYIQGVELANGFSELTDAKEQSLRFHNEIEMITANTGRGADLPVRFLQDLEKLSEAAGIALGVDRLFMLTGNYRTISSAVPFAPEDFL